MCNIRLVRFVSPLIKAKYVELCVRFMELCVRKLFKLIVLMQVFPTMTLMTDDKISIVNNQYSLFLIF